MNHVPKVQNVHICSRCKKRFSRNEHLYRHISFVHEEKKAQVCPFCDCGFNDKSHLRRHMSSKHLTELKSTFSNISAFSAEQNGTQDLVPIVAALNKSVHNECEIESINQEITLQSKKGN